MARRIEFGAQTDASPLECRSLSCGCRRTIDAGNVSRVEWCPRHEASHGQLAENAPGPGEKAVPARNAGSRRSRFGER
jgi:hypothetical protein